MSKLPNYLRTYRKHTSLSQDEVAFLLGSKKGSKVSRHEQCRRIPSLEALLAYEVVFGVPLRVLFAGIFAKVETLTRDRAKALIAELGVGRQTRYTARKIEALARVLAAEDSDPHAL